MNMHIITSAIIIKRKIKKTRHPLDDWKVTKHKNYCHIFSHVSPPL